MKLEFFYDRNNSDKEEVKKIVKKLENLKKRGLEFVSIDINGFSESDIFKLYSKAFIPAVSQKYKIRNVFGTHRRPGIYFGNKVPAILVYENDENPTDVYPHDDHGKIVTIEEFLNRLKEWYK